MIELGSRAREIGGGPAQAKGVTAGQRRICGPNQRPARAGRQFGERRPDPSHSRRTSEDLDSLTQIITAFIVVGGLQRGQLPDARSEEHTSELQSRRDLVCRLLLEKKKKKVRYIHHLEIKKNT